MSEDTYRGDISNPLTLNYYMYCWGNPVMMYDPSGNWPNWAQNAGNWIKNKATDIGNKSKGIINDVSGYFSSVDWSQVGEGVLQTVGGGFEFFTGLGIATAGTATGFGAVAAWAGGGYLMIDGASNAAGGLSKVVNALARNDSGETWNFVKNFYKSINSQYGEDFYNLTQLGIGIYCIGSGIKQLPGNMEKSSFPLGYIKVEKGAKIWSYFAREGNKLIKYVFTQRGLVVKSTTINIPKLGTGIVSIGTDGLNGFGLIESYFENKEDNEEK